MNPTPLDIKPRILSTSIDLIDPTACLDLALDHAKYFDLEIIKMKSIVKEVSGAVVQWKTIAKSYKIKKSEIDRMLSAFEHQDLKKSKLL